MSNRKTNLTVRDATREAVDEAAYWAVDGAVSWTLRWAVDGAVNGAVSRAVVDAVNGAVSRAAVEDSPHAALQDFLRFADVGKT